MAAFRPNIELGGLPANIEDIIDSVVIGRGENSARMLFGELSVRCDVTRVDNRTGEKPDREPLKWLLHNRPLRPDDPSSVTFAVNGVFPPDEAGKVIGVGDPVVVV